MVWGGNVLEQREGMLQGSFDEYCDLYSRKRDEPIRDIVWHFFLIFMWCFDYLIPEQAVEQIAELGDLESYDAQVTQLLSFSSSTGAHFKFNPSMDK